jgi:aerobic carbon-monoxide dehydrogenase medium subunit
VTTHGQTSEITLLSRASNAPSSMVPRSFEYLSPSSLEQALSYLDEHGSDSKVLAGGQSLIPLMKLRLASPKYLIDINRVSGLDYIREESGSTTIQIGSMTRHHSIETSTLLWHQAPIMPEAASMIGDPQVRNNGTLGGSLVHADPAADWGAVILALDASLKLKSSSGERVVSSSNFFVDSLTSALKANEILTEISFQVPKISGGSYAKLERKSGDFATVGVAAQLSLDSSGACERVGIGLTSVAQTNIRAINAESVLRGKEPTRDRIEETAKAAAEESKPEDDLLRGSAAYKRAMVRVFTERALTRALERAKRKKEQGE